MARAALLPVFLAAAAPPTSAQEDVDRALEGFEETPPVPAPDTPDSARRWWDLKGVLSLGSSINYEEDAPAPGQADYRGLSRLRAELNLELDLELPAGWKARIGGRGFHDFAYALKERGDFTHEVLDVYEDELEFQELWLQGTPLPHLDLKVGRQIVVWGRSDSLRVLDILNPLDNREPGLTDLEDLRLPVAMTKVDASFGPWIATGIAVHESRFDVNPPFGSDFYPFPARPPGQSLPANGGSDTEWAGALTGIFPGFDFSLHAARFFDEFAHLEPYGIGQLRHHSRLTMFGAGGNLVRGNWLFKAELARFDGLELFAEPGRDFARTDSMIGVEYAGFSEAALALELANRHLHGFDSTLAGFPDLALRNRYEAALRYTQDFRNDTIHLTTVLLAFGAPLGDDGASGRVSLDWDARDALSFGAGVVAYWKGDTLPLSAWSENDRIFLSARYSF